MVYLLSGARDAERDAQLAHWKAASEANRRALEWLQASWAALAEVDDVEDLLAGPKAAPPAPRAGRPAPPLQRRRLILGALAATACALALTFAAPLMQTAPPEDILLATTTGEIRTFNLSDGSQLTLDARSEVTGRFTRDQRALTLVSGNAYFDIARQPDRPLVVSAGDVRVEVLGTRFDVRRWPGAVTVSVEEGHVAVTGGQASSPVSLTGGRLVTYRPGEGFGESADFDTAQAAGWRRGQLSYVNARFGDIIEDVNRYSARPITLADSSLTEMRLTMSFPASQIDTMLEGLDAAYPMDIRYTSSEIHIYSVPE